MFGFTDAASRRCPPQSQNQQFYSVVNKAIERNGTSYVASRMPIILLLCEGAIKQPRWIECLLSRTNKYEHFSVASIGWDRADGDWMLHKLPIGGHSVFAWRRSDSIRIGFRFHLHLNWPGNETEHRWVVFGMCALRWITEKSWCCLSAAKSVDKNRRMYSRSNFFHELQIGEVSNFFCLCWNWSNSYIYYPN